MSTCDTTKTSIRAQLPRGVVFRAFVERVESLTEVEIVALRDVARGYARLRFIEIHG